MYNKHNLAVAKVASKGTIKPELASVLFTKTHTVATDSFRLVEISVPKDANFDEFPTFNKKVVETENALISAKHILKMKLPKMKSLPIVENLVIQNVGEDKAELITSDVAEKALNIKQVENVQGHYPEYRKIFPTTEPIATVTVNAEYLAEVLQILGELGTFGHVTIDFHGDKKPIIIKGNNENQEGTGLVMPVSKD